MFYNFAYCKGFVLSEYNFSEYTNDDTTLMRQALNRKDMYYTESIVTANQIGNGTGEEVRKIPIDGVSYNIIKNVNTNEEFLGYVYYHCLHLV